MYHTLTIVGNLGTEPEMRTIANGNHVTKFNVAANRTYLNNSGEKVKETIWFRISAWNKLAENASQFLHKGSKVLIVGRLQATEAGNPNIWTTKDGVPAASFEVTASEIKFLDSRPTGEAQAEPEAEVESIPF